MRVFKKKLDYLVPTEDVAKTAGVEESFAGDKSTELQADAEVQYDKKSHEDNVMAAKPSISVMEAQEDIHMPTLLPNSEGGVSRTVSASTEAVAEQLDLLTRSGMHQAELGTNPAEGLEATQLPLVDDQRSRDKGLPVKATAQSALHNTLQNVWQTVKDSKVLSLPWDSIQTVATFGNNFPRSLDKLSDNLLQRIGANADSVVDNVIVGSSLPAAERQYEVVEGTTLYHEPRRDDSQISANAEVPLPTKGHSPISPTQLKTPQESVSTTPEPSVDLLSSFTQTSELHKSTTAPSLSDMKTQPVLDSAHLGATPSDNAISNHDNVSPLETSRDVKKSVPTQLQQQTLDSTQSVMTSAVTDAAVSERAYLEAGNHLDLSEGGDKTFQPSEQIVPSRSSVEETRSSSTVAGNPGEHIQPSATNDRAEDIAEEQASWLSTLKRTLLGTDEQVQEEPSAAEDYTQERTRSWMGKEGSQGLPRADSGFIDDLSASQTVDDGDDSMVDTEDGEEEEDDDDDDDDDDDEETDATLEDVITEEPLPLNPNKEEVATAKTKANLGSENPENSSDVNAAESTKITDEGTEHHESPPALPIDIPKSFMDMNVQEEGIKIANSDELSFASVPPVEKGEVGNILQEKSEAEKIAIGSDSLSAPQSVDKSESDEDLSRKKTKAQMDPVIQSSSYIEQDVTVGASMSEPLTEHVSSVKKTVQSNLNEETNADMLFFQSKVPDVKHADNTPLPNGISSEANHDIDASSSQSHLSSKATPTVVAFNLEKSLDTDAPLPEKMETETVTDSKPDETYESTTVMDNDTGITDEAVHTVNVPPEVIPKVDTDEAEEVHHGPLIAEPQTTEETIQEDEDSITETAAKNTEQPEEQTSTESAYGFFTFFEELDLLASGKGFVDGLRPYMQLLIDLLPEPIHASLMDFEEQGLSPRVLVFTVISGGFLTFIIIAYYVLKRSSLESVLKLKLCQVDKKFFEAAAERDIVKEELDASKQQIVDLQSNLSEAQEAIDLLDSELLSAKNEGSKLQESVAMLQEQLDLQKNSVSDMQSNAKNKSQQYTALKEEHDDALMKIEDLEKENKKLRLEVDDNEAKYESTKLQVNLLEDQAVQLQENNKQLLREAEIWNQRVHELQDQVEAYSGSNKELKDSLSTKTGEIEVLKDIIQQLKVMQDDDTGAAGDSEKLQKLMDVSRITAELNAVTQEKSCIVEHLSAEIEKRKSLEDALSKTVTEVEQLRESHTVLSQQRDEAYTKLQVLSGYFKEKEIELQRELGVQEAMRQQSQESVLSVGQRAALSEQEVSMYKSQIEDLKKEIDSQGRSYKNQIAQHESKAHDSWLAARAAERKAEDARQEAALLRNKLTLIEQEKESLQGQGDGVMLKPMPKRFTGSNGEVPSPPRLDGEPSDLPVSGPPSLLREPLDSPRRMPFLPLDRPMPPPALGFPPPFLRDRFPPPPPMYDLHGPPFDLHGPPPPPYHPHHRPFDHRMSPPQVRRSPPLRRMSPPFDPHSPLPPRDYRSPPPIDRRGPPDRLQSPDPFDRRPPSGRHTSPPHLSRERNYPGPYERDFRERSPPRFHERGPPAGVLASGMRPGPPPLRRDTFPDNRIGALTNPRTSSPMVDQPVDPQAHPTTQV